MTATQPRHHFPHRPVTVVIHRQPTQREDLPLSRTLWHRAHRRGKRQGRSLLGRRGGTSYPPLRMLARRYGGQHRVGEVVDRLRCRRCHGRPALAALVENPAGNAPGRAASAPGWRVVLVEVRSNG